MKKYKISELYKRATQMADVTNTDFISHQEAIDLANEAWKEVFQLFVNNGDKQFVTETTLRNVGQFNGYTEYELPDDLYQIYSLKDEISGRVIPRHAESESVNSGTYEVVNDRIRIYGPNFTMGNLVLTYYVNPTWLTFPKENKVVSLPGRVLDTCNNSALCLTDNGLVIYNIKTTETIASDFIAYDPNFTYKLGNGHVVAYGTLEDIDSIQYVDYNGTTLYFEEVKIDGIFKDNNGFIYYKKDDKIYLMDRETEYTTTGNNGIINEYVISYDTENLYVDDIVYPLDKPINNIFALKELFDNDVAFVVIQGATAYLYTVHNYAISIEKLDVFALFIYGATNDGLITSNGTDVIIQDWMPDTVCNFPNEVYYTLIAANIAMRIIAKQNIENSGLAAAYDNAYNLYLNSLGQNDSYTRIRNVYA